MGHWYPLVNIQKAIENGHRNSGFTHEKWWFSIAMWKFTRGKASKNWSSVTSTQDVFLIHFLATQLKKNRDSRQELRLPIFLLLRNPKKNGWKIQRCLKLQTSPKSPGSQRKKPTPSHETPRWTIKFQVPKSLPQNLAMLAMTWG